jgi:predicted dinucleotide-binding enzyme
MSWRCEYGTLVATRVQHLDGRGQMEVRVVADLARDDGRAREQAQHLAVGVDLTVRAVLAGVLPSAWMDELATRVPHLGAA